MTTKTFKSILLTAVAVFGLGVCAITILYSCKKGNDDQKKTITALADRFAVWDNTNNQFISYFLDYDKFDSIVNSRMGYWNNYRFMLESISITDSVPTNININPEIKYVILDSEQECSYTFWLMGDFMTKRLDGTYTYYAFNDDIVSGNYSFDYFSLDTVFRVTYIRDSIIKTPLPRNNTSWQPKWTISCRSKNCIPNNPNEVACGKKKIDNHVWDCNYNCDFSIPNATCQREISWFLSLFKLSMSASV